MRTSVLILAILFSSTAFAKPFYRNKYWYYGRVVSAAVILGDALSTRSAIRACPTCVDSFMFFDVHSDASVAGAGLIAFGTSTLLSIGEYHFSQGIPSDRRISGWHLFGYLAQPATDLAAHGYGIVNNLELVAECRKAALGHC